MAEPSSTQGCCPQRSEPALQTDYVAKGTESKIEDLPIYTVGQGDKAIIFIYDIFGFNGGRTRQMCDQFAAEGYFVILPDVFRGESWDERNGLAFEKIMPWVSRFAWDVVKADLEKHVYPYLDSKGIKKIGMTGCCYGGGMTMLASANEKISCGVPFHAVINPQAAAQIAEDIKSPQCLISAGNDIPEIKEGGVVEKILKGKFGDKVVVKDFPDMVHGWVPRASFDVPENVRDVNKAMEIAIDFFKKNL